LQRSHALLADGSALVPRIRFGLRQAEPEGLLLVFGSTDRAADF